MDNIIWRSCRVDQLPHVLFGLEDGSNLNILPYLELLQPAMIAVGYESRSDAFSDNPPTAILVNGNYSQDFFSWLKVYASDVTPISQFARISTIDDYKATLSHSLLHNRTVRNTFERWASVVVGEALAQGENDLDLENMPLSRFSSCFTSTVGRVSLLHRSDDATRACVDRLRVVESDRRFVRRSLSVSDFVGIWSVCGMDAEEAKDPLEAVELAVQAASIYGGRQVTLDGFLHQNPGLISDSIEERVVAFNRFVNEVMHMPGKGSVDACLLAAATFLVGRGTSHLFLMRRIKNLNPLCYVWFGLLAGMLGPRYWSEAWIRAEKVAERNIRSRFEWSEQLNVDLAWEEFSWIRDRFEGADAFSSIQRLMPRLLSIEIFPGASCQFRMSGSSIDSESRQLLELSLREKMLRNAFEQFWDLAQKTRSVLDTNVSWRDSVTMQDELPLGSKSTAVKITKGRRTKKLDQ